MNIRIRRTILKYRVRMDRGISPAITAIKAAASAAMPLGYKKLLSLAGKPAKLANGVRLRRSACYPLLTGMLVAAVLLLTGHVLQAQAATRSGVGSNAKAKASLSHMSNSTNPDLKSDHPITIYLDQYPHLSYRRKNFELIDLQEGSAVKNKSNVHKVLALRATGKNAGRYTNGSVGSASKPAIQIELPYLEAGTYVFYTGASLLPATARKSAKLDDGQGHPDAPALSYKAGWKFNQQRVTERILYDGYKGGQQEVGKFDLPAGENKLLLFLPAGAGIASIRIAPYKEPGVPPAALHYHPDAVPPAMHPRVWVTPDFLPVLKERLNNPEDTAAWNAVQREALSKVDFTPDTTKEMYYDASLETKIRQKAFYYLVTEDKKVGQEAVSLLKAYYSVLSFGNVSYGDITREMGRAVYTGALVYDWCYELLTPALRDYLRRHMMRLARDMEIGWPPFIDPIVNGHANEAQVSRDLLGMGIAIYNEDSIPYNLVSYALLKELVPMRAFEYQSSRHNQGVDYGAYRFGWEMHGAMLYYRMLGKKLYPANMANIPHYWLNMRLPDGYMLRDGDMFSNKHRPANYYWKQPQTMLLSYAYNQDSLMKGEFYREGGLPDDPMLFLLVNDPAIKTVRSTVSLPTTHDFGKVLGGMMARTGWDNSSGSKDVVAEIRGGGYLFGNHQHSDAGAVQLYYHGMQFGDIGLYLSYGSAYDYNFNKRSIAHSMMLAYDPGEPLYFSAKTEDGGSRFNQRFPVSPKQVQTDPWFNGGSVLATDQGPDVQRPYYSYFKAQLAPAYSDKISDYTRSFCLINPKDSSMPKILILTDDMQTSKPHIQTYFQINAYHAPILSPDHLVLHSELAGITGYTRVDMVSPAPAEQTRVIKGADSSRSVFGTYYATDTSYPESKAYRIMISPKNQHPYEDNDEHINGSNHIDRVNKLITVFQMTEDTTKVLPIKLHYSNPGKGYSANRKSTAARAQILSVGNLVYVLSASSDLLADSVMLPLEPTAEDLQLVATDLKPGYWHIESIGAVTLSDTKGGQKGPAGSKAYKNNISNQNFYVQPGKQILYATLPRVAGSSAVRYLLCYGRAANADGNNEDYPPENGRPYRLEYIPQPLSK